MEGRVLLSAEPLTSTSIGSSMMVRAGNRIFLAAADATNGAELWTSDGTKAGTKLVTNFIAGEDELRISSIAAAGDDAIILTTSNIQSAIWFSDGTSAGTIKLLTLGDGSSTTGTPDLFTEFNGKTYFELSGSNGSLWRTDGTPGGTGPLTVPQLAGSDIYEMTVLNGELYFLVNISDQAPGVSQTDAGRWLYKSDGTISGTLGVKQLPASYDPPHGLFAAGNKIYFEMPTPMDSTESDVPWISDGTALGSLQLSLPKVAAPNGLIAPQAEWSINGKFVFAYLDNLWSTDGTNGGTALVKRLSYDGSFYEQPFETVDDSLLYFTNGSNGTELWQTDGTVVGTKLLYTGPGSYQGIGTVVLGRAGGDLYLSNSRPEGVLYLPTGATTARLVASEGTGSGTVLNNQFYYIGAMPGDTPQLLRADTKHGTIMGRVAYHSPNYSSPDIEPGLSGATVFIDSNRNGQLDAGERSQVVGSDGAYRFDGVSLGHQYVQMIPPAKSFYVVGSRVINASVAAAPAVEFSFEAATDATVANLQGVFFDDLNNNGRKDEGETAVAGGFIWLDQDPDERYEAGEPFARPDANGHYSISNVSPGDRMLGYYAPKGWALGNQSSDTTVFLLPNQTYSYDVALLAMHKVSGVVFDDLNMDGKQQANEAGVPGQSVRIDYGDSTFGDLTNFFTVKTDANGRYVAYVQPNNDFSASVVVGNGWRGTTKPSMSAPASGADSVLNFGVTDAGILNGKVFLDYNADGAQELDLEPSIRGWTVFLDTNKNGILDSGEKSTVTNSHGVYSLGSVSQGTYQVAAIPSNPKYLPTRQKSVAVSIRPGTIANTQFGFATQTTMSGSLFLDKNGDGERTTGESPATGIVLFVDDNGDGKLTAGEPTTTTDASGQYVLKALGSGPWNMGIATAGLRFSDLGASYRGGALLQQFGVTDQAEITLRLFDDSNGNGLRDSGESYDYEAATAAELYIAPGTSRNSIAYFPEQFTPYFGPIKAGKYTISMPPPSGWKVTAPSNDAYTVTLKAGQNLILTFGIGSNW